MQFLILELDCNLYVLGLLKERAMKVEPEEVEVDSNLVTLLIFPLLEIDM